MTIIHSPEIENNSTLNYNVCVIGAGMCGQIISSELNNKKVLIIESGSLNFDKNIQELNGFSSTGLEFRKNNQNRIRQVGGSANLWANQLMLLNKNDYERREWIDPSQYSPISSADLENYYDKAINKIYKKKFENIGNLIKFKKKNNKFIEKEFTKDNIFDFNNHFWPSKIEKFDIKSNFTKKLLKSKTVDLIHNFTATDLEIDEDRETVDFIKIKSGEKRATVKADFYILACGAIENARLLLNNKTKSKILDNQNIGKYFMEHPRVNLGLIKSKKKLPINFLFGMKYNNYSIKQSLTFPKNYMVKNNLLNSYAFIDPKFNESDEILFNNFLNGLKILIKKGKLPKLSLKNFKLKNIAEQIYFKLPPQVSNSILNNLLRIFFQRDSYNFSFDKMDINYQGEQFPNYKSSIYLSEKCDFYNQKKTVINWQLCEIDYKTIDHFVKILCDRFKKHDYLFFEENKNKQITDSSHHMGTTRMSLNTSDGVVDKNCKLHNLKNLYIGGSSVFRTSGSANPGLTNMALSIRLGEYINKIYD